MRARTLVLVVAVVTVPAIWGPALFLSLRAASEPTAAATAETGGAGLLSGRPPQPDREPVRIASVRGLDLLVHPAGFRGHGFHEAGVRSGALALRPAGRCSPCRARRAVGPRRSSEAPDLRYAVMRSRGRGSAPTSAVDVVYEPDAPVVAPVTGTVRKVERYLLYGRHPDDRVVIRARGAPGTQVLLLHMRGVRVAPGDRVVAGETKLGRARLFPFRSQVDRYVRGRFPHVHMEVVDARARRAAQSQD